MVGLDRFNRNLETLLTSNDYLSAKVKVRNLKDQAQKTSVFSIGSFTTDMNSYFSSLKKNRPDLYEIFEQAHREIIGILIRRKTGTGAVVD
ncbi:hypothetical protein HY990_05840 [Candidatus Micrarchaeota archaeon]|nr:hypothetical protein [Candidatus Micrarchaeota archaeon]